MRIKLREIVESKAVSDLLDAEIERHPRLQDTLLGVEWVLSRDPETGLRMNDGYWIYRNGVAAPGAPIVTVLYRFDDDRVEVLAVNVHTPLEE